MTQRGAGRPSPKFLRSRTPMLPHEMLGGWAGFVDAHWESTPKVLRSIVKRPSRLARELFSAAIVAAKGDTRQIRFMVSQSAKGQPVRPMPLRSDRNFERYLTRAAAESRSRDVTFIVNGVQASSAPLFEAILQFFSGLFDIVGTPLETEGVLFVTRSRVSAVGLHRDAYANFIFVAEGEKTFLLWPPSAIPGQPDIAPYSVLKRMRASAESVELKAGDMLYLPTGFYHCALQDAFSVHLGVVVSTVYTTAIRRFLLAELDPFLRDCFDAPGGMSFIARSPAMMITEIPAFMRASLRQLLAKACDADEILRQAFVRTQSAGGCWSTPAESVHPPIRLSDTVQARSSNLRLTVIGSDLLVGALGHVYRCPAHPKLIAMLQELASGAPFRVGDRIRRFVGTATVGGDTVLLDAGWILRFLQSLCQARWLRLINPQSS